MQRTFILIGLALMLAGCSDSGFDEQDTISIDEDQYFDTAVQASDETVVNFQVNVNSGPNVDFLVMSDTNYQQFQAGSQFVYEGCSRAPMNSASGTCTLRKGSWHLVLDNTDAGAASPPFNAANDPAVIAYHYWE
jgi:hypothetical protein